MCHKMQIPRVDILNPTNNVEGHIAFLTEASAEVSPGKHRGCFRTAMYEYRVICVTICCNLSKRSW